MKPTNILAPIIDRAELADSVYAMISTGNELTQWLSLPFDALTYRHDLTTGTTEIRSVNGQIFYVTITEDCQACNGACRYQGCPGCHGTSPDHHPTCQTRIFRSPPLKASVTRATHATD